MNQQNKIKGGLLPLKPDIRDFRFGKIFKPIDLAKIPNDFIIGRTNIEDQGYNDFCSAYATTSASELQENVELNPFWSFAVSKMISGNPKEWGQNLRTAMKVHIKYGAIKKSDFNRGEMTEEDLRYIEKYPKELFEKAKEHKKKSYFRVDI